MKKGAKRNNNLKETDLEMYKQTQKVNGNRMTMFKTIDFCQEDSFAFLAASIITDAPSLIKAAAKS